MMVLPRGLLYPLKPSQKVKDRVQMKMKRESEKKIENQVIVLRDNAKVWEKSAPSHKVIHIEQNL